MTDKTDAVALADVMALDAATSAFALIACTHTVKGGLHGPDTVGAYCEPSIVAASALDNVDMELHELAVQLDALALL